MSDNKTETLWEHIEAYNGGDSFMGKIKSYTVAGLFLGFFFVAIPLFVAVPLARGLGLQDWYGLVLIGSEIIIYMAGKSIRFSPRNN